MKKKNRFFWLYFGAYVVSEKAGLKQTKLVLHVLYKKIKDFCLI